MANPIRRSRPPALVRNRVTMDYVDINSLVPYAFPRNSGKRTYQVVGECYIWQGTKDKEGYGQLSVNGRTTRAHRFVYEQRIGPLTDGQEVRHTCDNASCVNPAHLLAGTHQENIKDKVLRGRQARGTGHWKARLTWESIAAIRSAYAGGERQTSIALRFGVGQANISRIVLSKNWRV